MKYYKREFLNKKEGIAVIESTVKCTGNWIEAELVITDCYRRVTLDFTSNSKQKRREMYDKVYVMINHLEKFAEALRYADDEHPYKPRTND